MSTFSSEISNPLKYVILTTKLERPKTNCSFFNEPVLIHTSIAPECLIE